MNRLDGSWSGPLILAADRRHARKDEFHESPFTLEIRDSWNSSFRPQSAFAPSYGATQPQTPPKRSEGGRVPNCHNELLYSSSPRWTPKIGSGVISASMLDAPIIYE
jgi:hypothetical protein